MKWFDGPAMRPVLVVSAGIILLGGGAHVKADFRFGTPVNLGSPSNSGYADLMPSVSSDGLEVYFWSNRPGGFGEWDLWVSTRTTSEDEWLPATNLGPEVNSAGIDAMPCVSADGLELFFSRGSESTGELMVARRNAKTEPWGRADNLGPGVNSPARDDMPRLTSDALELYFISTRSGGCGLSDIWVATRPTMADDWGPPVNLSMVNSGGHDQWVNLSPNSLTLLFQSGRPGGEYGGLYMSRRKSRNDPWTAPVYLGLPMGGSVYTLLSGISADGGMLYLSDHINYAPRTGGLGGADMWQVPVVPIVDFDGDGKAGMQDLLRLIDSWGQDDPVVDVGPTAFGDGVVDGSDLEVLMGYWEEEVDDPTLVAHWAMDETEGTTAYDSAGLNDAAVIGAPSWQAAGGVVDGALEFDGTTCVTIAFVLNPADGPFSVCAWVKGGEPGQVIFSQQGGANWVMASLPDGMLGTELKSAGRQSSVLTSETVITDGNWHRIAFSWDGANRVLYVDDMEVARDTQSSLAGSTGGLHIGAGNTLASGTFWSGLIDDVRIYDRAVWP